MYIPFASHKTGMEVLQSAVVGSQTCHLTLSNKMFCICFQDKAQALQNSCRSMSTENRSVSPMVESFDPPTPPSSTKKPLASSVIVID